MTIAPCHPLLCTPQREPYCVRTLRALAIAAGVAVLSALPARVGAADAPAPGSTVALEVTTLAGEDFDLARLRGHVVVVHFWATWCVPCIEEMPALETFYGHYRARGVEVIALSQDRTRDLDEVHHMMHHMQMTYPVAMAHSTSRNSLGEQKLLPVTYVIDGGGVVRAQLRPDTQKLTEENLARIVDPLLAPPQ